MISVTLADIITVTLATKHPGKAAESHPGQEPLGGTSRAVELVDATGIFTAWAYRPLTGYNREQARGKIGLNIRKYTKINQLINQQRYEKAITYIIYTRNQSNISY